jgi:hypothetical protein
VTTIGNTTGSLAPSTTQGIDRGEQRTRMDQVFDAVADELGMSKDDLLGELRGGTSLTEVAEAKGVSKDDLLATIKEAVGTDAPSGADLDDLATRIADHKGGPHRHHGPPPAPPADLTTKPGASLNDLLGQHLDTEL